MKETDPGADPNVYSPVPQISARDWVNAQLTVCDITGSAGQTEKLLDILGIERDRRPELTEEEPA